MNTLFDYAFISGILDVEILKSQTKSFEELPLDEKRDTIINIIKNFYIKYLASPTPS